ncbi:MAG: peptidyl-prolyl cis-trans isomerase, partial [Bacteroidales bacterium]|nr:peptidyl-prolyl cis-trans isomerase [Bacteroidales bacterium]
IEKGERFQSLAALYSQDPGSARKGGDFGYGARGDWASEFESMAFSLPVGEVSPIFETQFGFHILEVLDRKGELVHVRHILIRPEASDIDLVRAQKELDSVADMVSNGVYTMKEAVGLFSDDAGLQGDGIYINPMTRKPVYTADELEPMVYLAIQDLEEGQNTRALPYQTQDNQPAFRMFYVKKRIPPHRADLESDYDKIYEMALNAAKERTMRDWMRNKIENTYVRIMGRFKDCNFIYRWKSM